MAIESQDDYFDTICQLVKYEVWCNLQAVDFFRRDARLEWLRRAGH
jgi:hypothetical protein